MFKGFFSSSKTETDSQPKSEFSADTPSEILTETTTDFNQQKTKAPTINSLLDGLKLEEVKLKDVNHSDDDIEYLFIEENPLNIIQEKPVGSFGPLPMRTNYDKLLYGTGALYMMGNFSGGVYGFYRGLKTAKGSSFKLRTNSILNQVTRYGPMTGNSLGVMTAVWAILDTALENIRGKNDYYNHISSAFISGFLFKSTAGLRPALITGAILSGVVGAFGLLHEKEDFKGFKTGNATKVSI